MNPKPVTSPAYDFSGKVAIHYDEFLGPLYFEPYAIEVSNWIDPSIVNIALEIAAGTGRVTRHIRNRIPPASRLIASDISQDMLAVAEEKLRNENIEWKIVDAQELPFEDNSLDLVVCCFGYMLVPDKPKAFAEACRVLKPGGLLIFATWDKLELNAAAYAYRKIAAPYFLQSMIPEVYNLPFSMHDEGEIRSYLGNAGFSNINIEHVKLNSISVTAKQAVEGLTQGGFIYNEIMKLNPAWMEEISIKVEKLLSEQYGAAPMIAPMSALISRAWK